MPFYAHAPLSSAADIKARLEIIFPAGIADRSYVVREAASRIIQVMLYMDAVEGQGPQMRPSQVYRMSDEQIALQTDVDRTVFRAASVKGLFSPPGTPWYADNSREQVRDESLRDGLVAKGVVGVDTSIATTSSQGRYFLMRHFADLLLLPDDQFPEAIEGWREQHLDATELSRIRLMRERGTHKDGVSVAFPDGSGRVLAAGTSSQIVKAVIEVFAPRFLQHPAVVWISESGNHVVMSDDALMKAIGLPIDAQKLLPDVVLADLQKPMRLVFVEIVATDGPVTEKRKADLIAAAVAAGFKRGQVAFVSAFDERNASPLKKRLSAIATDSYIWCINEPDLLLTLDAGDVTALTRQEAPGLR
jgi:hypothetical protein